MLQIKIHICCKTLSNHIRINKSPSKNKKPASYLIDWGDHRKTISDKSITCQMCPVTSTAEGIVIAHNNRFLIATHEDHHWSPWSEDPKHFRCLMAVLNDYWSNYSELLQSPGSVSTETQIIFIWLKSKLKEKFYRSPNLTRWKDNLYVQYRKTVKFGRKKT